MAADGEDYGKLVAGEVAHYSEIYFSPLRAAASALARRSLLQPVPPCWVALEDLAAARVREHTGLSPEGHLVWRVKRKPDARILSLGCGAGGLEIMLARAAPSARIDALELNGAVLDLGRARASAEGLPVRFQQADLNSVELPPAAYDLVFCHASLHHIIELERLAAQMRQSLRPGGELLAIDVITRNGFLMWPETRAVVRRIFRELPARYRINHTAYAAPRLDFEIWEADTSQTSMECIRTEDILPVLDASFTRVHFVPFFSIARRFLDTMYGPNYDVSNQRDFQQIEMLWNQDVQFIDSGRLKPETFFGLFSPKR